MTRSIPLIVVAVLLAELSLTTSGEAADRDALMHEFRVAPAGLKPAPLFSLQTIEGKTATLGNHRGRPILLYFWATW